VTPAIALIDLAVALALGASPHVPSELPNQHADYTGTWVLDVGATDFGMSPRADSGVTVITRADDRLIMSRTTYAAMGTHGRVEFDLPTDGSTHEAVGAEGTAVPANVQWRDGTLVLTIIGESNVGPMEIVDHMTVDGDVLRIERSVMIPGVQGLTQSLVMRRQT
jgi:hypothetical protein